MYGHIEFIIKYFEDNWQFPIFLNRVFIIFEESFRKTVNKDETSFSIRLFY